MECSGFFLRKNNVLSFLDLYGTFLRSKHLNYYVGIKYASIPQTMSPRSAFFLGLSNLVVKHGLP